MFPSTQKGVDRTKRGMQSSGAILGLGGLVIITVSQALMNGSLNWARRDDARIYRLTFFAFLVMYVLLLWGDESAGDKMIYGIAFMAMMLATSTVAAHFSYIRRDAPEFFHRGYEQAWFRGTIITLIILGVFHYVMVKLGGWWNWFGVTYENYHVAILFVLAATCIRQAVNAEIDSKIAHFAVRANTQEDGRYILEDANKTEKILKDVIYKNPEYISGNRVSYSLAGVSLVIQALVTGLIF